MKDIKTNMSDLVKEVEFEGKTHYAIPTILITEGVHNKIYYPGTELSKFPEAWNGRPIPFTHPEKRGQPITANSPRIHEDMVTGKMFDCKYLDGDPKGVGVEKLGRLTGMAYVDKEKAQKLSPEFIQKLNDNQMIEVSTGLFTEDDFTPGTWNGEKFEATAKNYRPDHLAILLHDVGACSIKDGAGMPRVNSEDEMKGFKSLGGAGSGNFGHSGRPGELGGCGGGSDATGSELNKMGKDVKQSDKVGIDAKEKVAVADKIKSALAITNTKWHEASKKLVDEQSKARPDENKIDKYTREVTSLYNEMNRLQTKEAELNEHNNQQESYHEAIEEHNGKANSLYIETAKRYDIKTNKEENVMDKKAKVKALVEAGHFTAEDSELLEATPDTMFSRIEVLAAKPFGKKLTDEEQTTLDAEKLKTAEAEKAKMKKNEDESIAAAKELKDLRDLKSSEAVVEGIKLFNETKKVIVDSLKANKRNKFSEEQLMAKSMPELQNLAELAGNEMDFSGRSAAVRANREADNAVPEMPKMEFKK